MKNNIPEFDNDKFPDSMINTYIIQAEQDLENEFNRGNPFYISDYTETLDGNGTDLVKLSNYPIISITSVTIYDDLLTTDDYTPYLQDGYIILKTDAKCDNQNIVVVYEAGLYIATLPVPDPASDPVPEYLKEVVLLSVENIMLQKSSESEATSGSSSESDEWSIEDFKTKVSSGNGSSGKAAFGELKALLTDRLTQFTKINCVVL